MTSYKNKIEATAKYFVATNTLFPFEDHNKFIYKCVCAVLRLYSSNIQNIYKIVNDNDCINFTISTLWA